MKTNFWREKAGFFTIDVLLLTAIVISIASIWAVIVYFNHVQKLAGQRTTAIFLAQGYLNKVEHQILTRQKLDLVTNEEITLNDITFELSGNIAKEDEAIYIVKVNVKWHYEHKYQSEQQDRRLAKF